MPLLCWILIPLPSEKQVFMMEAVVSPEVSATSPILNAMTAPHFSKLVLVAQKGTDI
jgi:hypothetical protein